MNAVYPLIFEPNFKHRIWGGRNFERLLDKPLPGDGRIGESWEVADLPSEESIVANGREKGQSLHALVNAWGKDLLGNAAAVQGRFPLLVKFLDAQEVLSVQVHPDKQASQEMGDEVRPKYEAWYVIDAKPGASIYCGLKAGVTHEMLIGASKDGSVGDLLQRYEAKPGDCYYLPAGTVHAIGAGLVIAEPQTPSDVTYRLFDWNRIDPQTGQGRQLHLEQAIRVTRTHYTTKDIIQLKQPLKSAGTETAVRLVTCEAFHLDRYEAAAGSRVDITGGEMAVWMMLTGHGRIISNGFDPVPIGHGQTTVLPAGLAGGVFNVEEESTWLRISVPQVE